MFIGHLAVGFAAKRAAPRTTLGLLMAAPLLLDLIWPVFVLSGVERLEIEPGNTAFTPLAFVHYPFTHSFAAAAVWALAAAGVYWAAARYRKGALVIGLAVISHWFMDAIVHKPDLPLYPGSRVLAGLGLWNSITGTIVLEALLFTAGVWIYATATTAIDRTGRFAFWSFVAVAAAIYVAAASGGPPPPSPRAVAIVGLSAWLFPLWAGWFDRHRELTRSSPPRARK